MSGPDWVTVITTVLSVGVIGAAAKGYAKIMDAHTKAKTKATEVAHTQEQENRETEVGVLHGAIERMDRERKETLDEYRRDRDDYRKEMQQQKDECEERLKTREREYRKLQDYYNACQLEKTRLAEREAHNDRRQADNEVRIVSLEARIRELTAGG